MITKLTEKQHSIYLYIKDFIEENKYSPTLREIAERFNITVKGVYDHIQAIKRRGYIDYKKHKARTIVIL